jgi:hypothetical protein
MSINNKVRFTLLTTGLVCQSVNGADQLNQFPVSPHLLNPSGLQRLESLNPIQRAQLRLRIQDFVKQFPNLQVSKHQFLVDKTGVIYVLEKNEVPESEDSIIAMPSCIEPGHDSAK